jgi:DNA-binding transcriptional LysR family regulator
MTKDWDDLRFFLAIARARSLTAAGKALGVSQPTVSRRLDSLEARLNVRLFDRTRQGYELTAVGMELLETAQRVDADLAEADRKIYGKDQDARGGLRVTFTETLLNGYLAPFLWQFLREHPGIELSVICTDAFLSLSRSDADLAIRFTQRPPETLAGRRLTAVAYGIYAARGPKGAHLTIDNRQDWDWVGIYDDTYNRMVFGTVSPGDRLKHRVDSVAAMQSMVRVGLGVTLLPCYVADRDPDLRRIDPEPLLDSKFDMWLLYHPDVRRVYRVRLFGDFIIDLIKTDRDLFEGRRAL